MCKIIRRRWANLLPGRRRSLAGRPENHGLRAGRVDLPESPVHGDVTPKPKAHWGKTKGAGKRIRSGTRTAGGGRVALAIPPLEIGRAACRERGCQYV